MLELPACRPLRSAAPTLCKMDALCWKGFIARSGTWQGSWRHSAFSRVLRVSTVGYGSLTERPACTANHAQRKEPRIQRRSGSETGRYLRLSCLDHPRWSQSLHELLLCCTIPLC